MAWGSSSSRGTHAQHPASLLASHCDCEGMGRWLWESVKHASLKKEEKKDRQKKRKRLLKLRVGYLYT